MLEGQESRRHGDLDAAQAAYTSALRYHPKLAEAYYARGNVHLLRFRATLDHTECEGAIRDYQETVLRLPTFGRGKAFWNLAVAYYQLAEHTPAFYFDAARALLRLVEFFPRDAEAHFFLATIFDRHLEGQEALAARHYQKYAELGGRNARAQERLLALAPFLKKQLDENKEGRTSPAVDTLPAPK